jgi:hypothetical protein
LSQLAEIGIRFRRHLQHSRTTLDLFEDLLQKKALQVAHVNSLYSSYFLSCYCSWEAYLEDAVFKIACGRSPNGRKRIYRFPSNSRLRELLLFPRDRYLAIDLDLAARAVQPLLASKVENPFKAVTNLSLLADCIRIRNAVAHKSPYSESVFRNKVNGVQTLPTKQRYPGPFLRHAFRTFPRQTRFELYITALHSASLEIEQAWHR